MARLFVALWPPEEVVETLATLRRKDQRGVRFVPPEQWHVTLRFLGEADPDEVVAVLSGAVFEPAEAVLGPGVDVLSERALVLPVDGVDHLAAEVARCTASLGQPTRRRFTGHLTLARLKPHADLPPAMGAFVTAEWPVHEVALVQSRLAPDGPTYTTLATFPVPT